MINLLQESTDETEAAVEAAAIIAEEPAVHGDLDVIKNTEAQTDGELRRKPDLKFSMKPLNNFILKSPRSRV
jgi:hypothetical protein